MPARRLEYNGFLGATCSTYRKREGGIERSTSSNLIWAGGRAIAAVTCTWLFVESAKIAGGGGKRHLENWKRGLEVTSKIHRVTTTEGHVTSIYKKSKRRSVGKRGKFLNRAIFKEVQTLFSERGGKLVWRVTAWV